MQAAKRERKRAKKGLCSLHERPALSFVRNTFLASKRRTFFRLLLEVEIRRRRRRRSRMYRREKCRLGGSRFSFCFCLLTDFAFGPLFASSYIQHQGKKKSKRRNDNYEDFVDTISFLSFYNFRSLSCLPHSFFPHMHIYHGEICLLRTVGRELMIYAAAQFQFLSFFPIVSKDLVSSFQVE